MSEYFKTIQIRKLGEDFDYLTFDGSFISGLFGIEKFSKDDTAKLYNEV